MQIILSDSDDGIRRRVVNALACLVVEVTQTNGSKYDAEIAGCVEGADHGLDLGIRYLDADMRPGADLATLPLDRVAALRPHKPPLSGAH